MLMLLKWLRAIRLLAQLRDPAHPAVGILWIDKIADWLLTDELGNILTDALSPAPDTPSKVVYSEDLPVRAESTS